MSAAAQQGFRDFLAMGGYGAYVWPAYAVAALVIGGMALHTALGWRRWCARVAALEKAGSAP